MKKETKPRKPRQSKKLSELIGIKKSWCDYAADDFKPKYLVYRFDDRKGNRFYYFLSEGQVVIASGITEPFGAVSTERTAINEWKKKHQDWEHLLDVSSEYGSLLHILFGGIALRHTVDKTILESMRKLATDNKQSLDMPTKDALALIKFQEDYQLIPLLVEAQLGWQCPESGQWLCMTVDILAKMVTTEVVKTTVEDGVYQRGEKKGQPKFIEQKTEVKRERILLGDLKSNFFEKEDKSYYETHKLQLIGGVKAIEQNFGIKVDGAFNFSPKSWRTSPSYSFYEWNFTEDDYGLWDDYWRLIRRKKLNLPQGSFLVADTFKDSSDFKFVSYQEYAEQQLLPLNK